MSWNRRQRSGNCAGASRTLVSQTHALVTPPLAYVSRERALESSSRAEMLVCRALINLMGKTVISILTERKTEMKKRFKMNEVDCANCAAKMEAAIRKIPGVHEASLNFMTQKLTIDADDDRFDEIMQQAQKCCEKVDAGTKIIM